MYKDYGNALYSYLPWYDQKNKLIRDLVMALEIAYRRLDYQMEVVERNLYVDTILEKIPMVMKKLGLDNLGGDVSDQRGQIQAYLNYLHEQTTKKIVEELVAGMGNGKSYAFLEKNKKRDVYDVYFQYDLNKPQNLDKIFKMLNRVLPAHLDFYLNMIIARFLKIKSSYGVNSYLQYLCGEHLCSDIPYNDKVGYRNDITIGIKTGNNKARNNFAYAGKYKYSGEINDFAKLEELYIQDVDVDYDIVYVFDD